MDFTREPIIQTVITPKEGCKIAVRSSKNSGQEEFFVDAVEVVSFGHAIFFRSLERPKSFLVPASDYEVLEVREARMVLKNVGIDRAIKISGGRDAVMRGGRDHSAEKSEASAEHEVVVSEEPSKAEPKAEPRLDKKRDRRRNARRRRGRDDAPAGNEGEDVDAEEAKEHVELPKPRAQQEPGVDALPIASIMTSLLPPPSRLISETISQYRDAFKSAFFTKDEDAEKPAGETTVPPTVPLEQPEFGSFEMSEEEHEQVYQQRHAAKPQEEMTSSKGDGTDSSCDEHDAEENTAEVCCPFGENQEPSEGEGSDSSCDDAEASEAEESKKDESQDPHQ